VPRAPDAANDALALLLRYWRFRPTSSQNGHFPTKSLLPAIFFSFAFKIKRKENSKRESAGQAHEQQIPVLRFVFVRFALLNGGIRVFVVHGIPYISACCFMRSAKSFVCFPVPPPQLCAIFMQQVTQPIDNVHPQLISI
jgi:hypothetical protein